MVQQQVVHELEAFIARRYRPAEHPALDGQLARFSASRPFAGRRILDCTPLFANTLAKFIPLVAGGAELSIGLDERIPNDPDAVAFVRTLGLPVLSGDDRPERPFDVILDCDGSRAGLVPSVGVCELTRSGLYRYSDSVRPVVFIDASKIKEIETSIGTGDGFMRAHERLGRADWAGKSVLVFGLGKVGRGVAYRCAKAGATVAGVDRPDSAAARERPPFIARFIGSDDADAIREAVGTCDHLVTATGVRGAMVPYNLAPAILARPTLPVISAIGIEDEWLDSLDHSLIEANGRAINFLLDEPTLLRYIDPTMALSNESAADLLAGKFPAPGIREPLRDSEARCLEPVVECGLITDELREMGFI